MKRIVHTTLAILSASAACILPAQTAPHKPELDVAATYVAERSLEATTGQNFWMQGGAVEIGANLQHGLGVAANFTGTHAGAIGSDGIPLSLLAFTLGPRYRWHHEHRLSLYGEGLFGAAYGFNSQFPLTSSTFKSSSSSFAVQLGGGVDYHLSARFGVRALEAGWVHTQFPNGTDNEQNTLRLGAGIVYRIQ